MPIDQRNWSFLLNPRLEKLVKNRIPQEEFKNDYSGNFKEHWSL